MVKGAPNIWRPWCFECRQHVAGAEWTRMECLRRWSQKCGVCGRRSYAPSVLFRNILLVPVALICGAYLSALLKNVIISGAAQPLVDAMGPLLGLGVALFYVLPSWLRWIRFYRQVEKL